MFLEFYRDETERVPYRNHRRIIGVIEKIEGNTSSLVSLFFKMSAPLNCIAAIEFPIKCLQEKINLGHP